MRNGNFLCVRELIRACFETKRSFRLFWWILLLSPNVLYLNVCACVFVGYLLLWRDTPSLLACLLSSLLACKDRYLTRETLSLHFKSQISSKRFISLYSSRSRFLFEHCLLLNLTKMDSYPKFEFGKSRFDLVSSFLSSFVVPSETSEAWLTYLGWRTRSWDVSTTTWISSTQPPCLWAR